MLTFPYPSEVGVPRANQHSVFIVLFYQTTLVCQRAKHFHRCLYLLVSYTLRACSSSVSTNLLVDNPYHRVFYTFSEPPCKRVFCVAILLTFFICSERFFLLIPFHLAFPPIAANSFMVIISPTYTLRTCLSMCYSG